jgi:hypothetical protein
MTTYRVSIKRSNKNLAASRLRNAVSPLRSNVDSDDSQIQQDKLYSMFRSRGTIPEGNDGYVGRARIDCRGNA